MISNHYVYLSSPIRNTCCDFEILILTNNIRMYLSAIYGTKEQS